MATISHGGVSRRTHIGTIISVTRSWHLWVVGRKGKICSGGARTKKTGEVERKAELKRIKAEEKMLMDEAMGKKAPRERAQVLMEQEELKEVLKRGTVENDMLYHDTERVEGLGFAPTKVMAGMEKTEVDISHLLEGKADEQMAGTDNPDMWERIESVPSPKGQVQAQAPVNFDKQSRKADKQERKAAKKQAKKEVKKEKKDAKKEAKKEAKQDQDGARGRDRHRSRDRSRDRSDHHNTDRDRSRRRSQSRSRDRNRGRPQQRQRHDSDSD